MRARGEESVGEHGVDAVFADRHVREGVETGFVGDRLPLIARADIDERDVDAGQHSSSGVLDHSGDLCRVELCVRRRGAEDDDARGDNKAPIHSSSSHQGPSNSRLICLWRTL